MRHVLPPLLVLALLALVACSSSSESSTSEDDIRRAGLDPKVKKLVDKANCAAGNSVHETVRFTPSRFDAAKALDEIKAADRERGCPGRDYSSSKADGVSQFNAFLTRENVAFTDQCTSVEDNLDGSALVTELRQLADDPANLGVYSSLHDRNKNDDPVHCYIFRFYVYRANGTLAKFDFDWSD
jgi:hypothetical protein